jgi:hypothetical protein
MVWIYDDPPFTKREKNARRELHKKLKDRKFADTVIKVISLYIYLKRVNPTSVNQLKHLAYFDKAKTRSIFNEKNAKTVLISLKQKGGDTKYPYTDVAVKGILRDYTPEIIGSPISSVYATVTDTVNTLKDNVPFSDLALEAIHGTTELGVTTANGVGEMIAGPVGAAVVAPFTAIVVGLVSTLSTIEGDIGGAVAHLANWVPGLGLILNKAMIQTERMANTLQNHETISELIPYMTEYHNKIKNEIDVGGKRLSTIKNKIHKWRKKTTRNKLRIY